MADITLQDKVFEPYISKDAILERTLALCKTLKEDYHNKKPLFIVVLNGAFVFAADLLKNCKFELEICFVKVTSYEGTESTGKIKQIIGLDQDITNRHIIIIEDIIDTGHTIEKLVADFQLKNPASIKIASLLLKPGAYKKNIPIDYVAIEIENKFVVGYGLDYNQIGRNINGIYILKT